MSLSKTIQLTVNGYDIKLSSELKFYQNDRLKLIFEINEYGIDVAGGLKVRTLMPVQPLSARLLAETIDDSIPEWQQPTGSTDAYMIGDKVTYNGQIYECTSDYNVYAPDVSGWKLVE